MTILAIKLFAATTPADLNAQIVAAQGSISELLNDVRMSDVQGWFDPQNDQHRLLCAVAYAGAATPGTKTANLQSVCVEADDLASVQAALTAALAEVVHSTAADGVTTTPGHLTSASSTFATTDVGRKIKIGTVEKVITVRNSATDVSYDNTAGNFNSGTGQTFSLLGAISVQDLEVSAYRDRDGDPHYVVFALVEGQLAP